MQIEFGKREPWALFIGIIVTIVWMVVICLYSALYGPLGQARGIEIGPWVFGSISRYWDPFILGSGLTLVVWLWKHAPKTRPLPGIFRGDEFVLALAGTAFWILVLFILIHNRLVMGATWAIVFVLMAITLAPGGLKGATFFTFFSSSVLWIHQGIVVAFIFALLVWALKWLNWWVVNILRTGFKSVLGEIKRAKEGLESSAL